MNSAMLNAIDGTVRIMQKQQVHANNLANVSTAGFRADYLSLAQKTVDSVEQPNAKSQWSDFDAGPMSQTGRDLDLAIQGEGWFVVQDEEGKEAYTRSGSFNIDGDGFLQTASGKAVMGDGGAIVLPPYEQIVVGQDGRITVKVQGARNTELAEVGMLRLVNPPAADLAKGEDGLFRIADGKFVPADPAVTVASGFLEGSNVNAVKEMVSFIELSRQYEMHLKTMKSVEKVSASGDKMLQA